MPVTEALAGIHPQNHWHRITRSATGGEQVHLFLEAGGNPAVMQHGFRPTPLGDRATAGEAPRYALGRVDLAVLDRGEA